MTNAILQWLKFSGSGGGLTSGSSGEFVLRQSDYGIAPVNGAGGALKLKDELKQD